ncbi:L-fucose isomerase [Vagococcus sp. BWB3-3]|uniref:L-fucose isomerase n=1 Tax=Vagococcus allomyrinae TaxID=2794353 RepID=A0A940SQ66_9ENTE|nr:L-fucose isomerase [Vagococcus allomyrinae]MBP1039387.1 L-fucose isomerase [Vagococcus allomyrinae]
MREFARIGIRPTIDGRRRGVRESLEKQTMAMAQSVAEFLTSSLRYPDGSPVECVIADSTIGRVQEAMDCQRQFKRENVGLTITVTPCWCYGTETMDLTPDMPHAIWGFNGTERPGAVYLAAAMSGYAQKGIPAFAIYGKEVQDADATDIPTDVQEKLLTFAKAGLAVANIRDYSYLAMGGVCMGIAGSIVKDDFFQEYLGMRNESIDMSEFTRRIDEGIYDPEEYQVALKWVKANCLEGPDNNPEEWLWGREELDAQWETVVKMTLIARDLMIGNPRLAELGFAEEACGHGAIAAGFQGQRQWTDHFPNGDFMETILNTSFDWNGKRAPFILATENDSLNGATMLLNYMLTNTAQIFADVRTFWSADSVERVTGHRLTGHGQEGVIHLINSGAATLDGNGQASDNGKPIMKPHWELTADDQKAILANTSFRPASKGYFRGGGFSTNYLTKGEMPLTMARINFIKGIGPVLQIAEGYSVELPEAVHHQLDDRTDPTWPTTWFAPKVTGKGAFTDVYSVMDNWGANHGAISYGHIGADLITLAAMLRIPVNMHNVAEDQIFRPRVWGMFGTEQLEGADYRACQNYGPLYK